MTKKGNDRFFQGNKCAVSETAETFVSLAISEADTARKATNSNTRSLQERHQETFRVTVEAIVLDLALCHLEPGANKHAIAITRSREVLARADDLKPLALNSTLPARLDDLERAGWLLQEVGGRSSSKGARLTRILPGPRLIEEAARLGLRDDDIGTADTWSSILIKDDQKKILKGDSRKCLLATPEGRRIKRDLDIINHHIARQPLVWTDGETERDLRGQMLQRIFNNARLDHGGRFYIGSWMDMKDEARFAYLRLAGKPLVKLDFKSMQPRIAYALAGETPPTDDVYTLQTLKGLPREAIKIIMVAMFWDTKPRERMPHGVRPMIPRRIAFRDIRSAIYRDHPALAVFLEKGRGAELMFHESEIMNKILLNAAERDLPVLPVHDALYCPLGLEEEVKTMMERAFRDQTGGEGVIEVSYGPLREPLENSKACSSGD